MKESVYKKLQLRLTIICAVSTGIVLFAMSSLLLYFSINLLTSQHERSFENDVSSIVLHLTTSPILDHSWLKQTEANQSLYISISSNGNALFYNSQNPNRERLANLALEEAKENHGYLLEDGVNAPYFEIRDQKTDYHASITQLEKGIELIVLKSQAAEVKQKSILIETMLFTSILAFVAIILFAWNFSKKAIKPVEESQKKQSEFIAAASHEIRSPLAVILSTATAIKSAPKEKVERFASTIENESYRLSRLTNDLLLLASSDSGKLSINSSKFDPETLLISTFERFESLAKEKGIAINIRLPDGSVPAVNGDLQRIEQVLAILVDNAITYTPRNGTLTLGVTASARAVDFSVADSGVGISDSDKKKIFDPFFQADQSHTDKQHFGLGLSVAKDIISLHKGKFWVEDSSTQGTVFRFTLPIN